MIGALIDAGLVGTEGDVRVFVQVGEEHGVARVRWLPEYDAPEVLEASSPNVRDFVYADGETQDWVEQLHSRFVAEHRCWRGRWVRCEDVEA